MKRQTAKLPTTPTYNGRWADNKEQTHALAVVAVKSGKFAQPVTVRWWMSRTADGASPVYCSIWTDGGAGHGRARGYGYDKRSAALAAALDSAGITLSKSIAGVGDSATREAVGAIARALGYRKTTIVEL